MGRASRLSAVLLLLVPAHLAAQERGGHVGFGVTFNPAALVLFDNNESQLFSPVGLNNVFLSFRARAATIEPELGVFRTAASTSGGGYTSKSSFENIRLGLGILATLSERGSLRPYVGPRFGIIRTTEHDEYSGGGSSSKSKATQTNWYAGLVVGGQYFFTRHFSLGGEVQVMRMAMGDRKVEPNPNPSPSSTDASVIGTGGLVMLRWYF